MLDLKRAIFLLLALMPIGATTAAESTQEPVEVIVRGRVPGPPLWRVINGGNTLWIFPYLARVPQNMVWDDGRVARLIAESQQFLDLPETRWAPPASVMLNPINAARSMRNAQRTIRLPDGQTLADVLPEELHARFSTLQARYFPANDEVQEDRPLFAGRAMINIILKQEGLDTGDDILKTIRRHVRRNRGIEHTEISVKQPLGENYGEYTDRLGAVYASFPPLQEQACFDQQLRYMEEELELMRRRANAWANGDISGFNDEAAPLLVVAEVAACEELFSGPSSPEHAELEAMKERMHTMWLEAAENALATNTSTFAILPINQLLAGEGLLARLRALGYEVREP